MKLQPRTPRPLWGALGVISPGAWIILILAVVSTILVACRTYQRKAGLEMWAFAQVHVAMYVPLVQQWNQTHETQVTLIPLGHDVLAQRMISGFFSKTPLADLIEVERGTIGAVFGGPLDQVGFCDLTDILHRDGVYEQLNEPSFSPWTSRGHIFGLPHDVHPVMLAYRADLVEQAGIDVSKIETWDDFVRAFSPLMKDLDSEGHPKHYPLNIWTTAIGQIEALMLQAGGNYFDEDGRPIMDSPQNARVISTVVSWVTGPGRIAADAPEFTAMGNQLKLQGYVVASLAPDWLLATWKQDLGGLSGKMKLMPLPAWDRGGRRTSVWGGTMLGIPKASPNFDKAWNFAKTLYLSPQIAQRLYERAGIVTPVKRLWEQPFFDVPSPFFCGQAPDGCTSTSPARSRREPARRFLISPKIGSRMPFWPCAIMPTPIMSMTPKN